MFTANQGVVFTPRHGHPQAARFLREHHNPSGAPNGIARIEITEPGLDRGQRYDVGLVTLTAH